MAGRDYAENGLYADTIYGQYATVAVIEGDPQNRNSGWLIIDGTATAANDLPNQTANYTGIWALTDGADEAYGYLLSEANFDSRKVGFYAYDEHGNPDLVGAGSATINGSTFEGNLATWAASGISADGNLRGSFFGPQAAELAGHLSGTTSDGDVAAGYIIGTKNP